MLAAAWAESAAQGMTPGETPGETWTCTVALNLDTDHQRNNTALGSAEVVVEAACSPVWVELSAEQAELGVELLEGDANGLWAAGSWLVAEQ